MGDWTEKVEEFLALWVFTDIKWGGESKSDDLILHRERFDIAMVILTVMLKVMKRFRLI